MPYVSQLQGKKIWDAWGQPVGRFLDVLVGNLERPFPPVQALAFRDGDSALRFIHAHQVTGLYPSIILNVPQSRIEPYTPRGDELWLVDQVLDRQIVDTEGRRVVRVNDLQIMRVGERYSLVGADVGGLGLLRRLGAERLIQAVLRLLGRPLREKVIPWEDVASLQHEEPLRLRTSRAKISKLPPADIALIIGDLDRQTGEALIAALDNEALAHTMEEIPADMQVSVLSHLQPERAADVLEAMGPDEAADLIADLPSETSQQLLGLMEAEDARDVRRLLEYPEDSAGGIMTTEFAQVPAGIRVGDALDYLRRSEAAQDDEAMYYVFIVDEQQRLRGVISLRDLVMAPPDTPIEDLIQEEPTTVGPHALQEQISYLVAKYDLLAVPVVDEQGVMLGIVTVDDAIDAVLPTAWKKRLPRFF